ncbi:c-type cytochrome [Limnohabitans sp. 2KL-1]|uniref:c-type cytochrome n=1 Tax=Limnohabitans sp. 2KL-1 TaxID=1100699 RepID=UPI000D3D1E95
MSAALSPRLKVTTAWFFKGLLFAASALLAGQVSAQTPPPSRFADDMAERTRACTACHGDQGRAGPDGYYPRLAGKPAGYLHNQLRNFAQGRRHYDLMARLVDPLSDAYLGEIAQYFADLKLPYPAPTANNAITPERLTKGQQLVTQGDAARGLPACTQCHGVRLTGVQPNVPGLLGLPLDYLNAQLGAWQTAQRRAHAPDCMAEIVKRMPSEDLIAVSSWLARQPLPADTRPAERIPSGPALPDALRCGSAPELSAAQAPTTRTPASPASPAKPQNGGRP